MISNTRDAAHINYGPILAILTDTKLTTTNANIFHGCSSIVPSDTNVETLKDCSKALFGTKVDEDTVPSNPSAKPLDSLLQQMKPKPELKLSKVTLTKLSVSK
jgi:hypothetical protein